MANDMAQLKKEHNLFQWSQPVGYDFASVDDAINDYKETISNVYELLAEKDQFIKELQAQNERIVNQMTNTQMQMEALMVPKYSEEKSLEILEDFQQEGITPDNPIDIPQSVTEPANTQSEKPGLQSFGSEDVAIPEMLPEQEPANNGKKQVFIPPIIN